MNIASLRKALAVTALAAGGSLLGASSRADVPPPEDYVEACTLENHVDDGTECVLCPSGRENGTACSDQYTPEGYKKVCQTYGASAFSELWCRPKMAVEPADTAGADAAGEDAGGGPVALPTPPRETETEAGGGGCAGGGASGLGLVGALAMLLRRRG